MRARIVRGSIARVHIVKCAFFCFNIYLFSLFYSIFVFRFYFCCRRASCVCELCVRVL